MVLAACGKCKNIMSCRKVSRVNRDQLPQKTRASRGLRQHLREVRDQIRTDHDWFDALVWQADRRKEWLVSAGIADPEADPLSVWVDYYAYTGPKGIDIHDLPEWEDLGERMKCLLFNQVALHFGGKTFTVKIRPKLLDKWERENRNALELIEGIVSKSLGTVKLNRFAYCYVVEGHDRTGRKKVPLHIHGIFLDQDDQTKKLFEEAMRLRLAGLKSSGVTVSRGVDIIPAYDRPRVRGRGHWVTYMMKNILRSHPLINGRRIFFSREATATATEFWRLIRNEPVRE